MPTIPKWIIDSGGLIKALQGLKTQISNNEGDILQLGIDTLIENEQEKTEVYDYLQWLSCPTTIPPGLSWVQQMNIMGDSLFNTAHILDPVLFAALLHTAYETHAVAFGWKTQESCKTTWEDLPEANQKTMIAACAEVLQQCGIQMPKVEDKDDESLL